jgi:hypothetical protein
MIMENSTNTDTVQERLAAVEAQLRHVAAQSRTALRRA